MEKNCCWKLHGSVRALLIMGLFVGLWGCASQRPAPEATPPVAASKPASSSVVINLPGGDSGYPAPTASSVPAETSAAKPDGVTKPEQSTGWTEQGIASWYGPRFHGRRTASGEVFNTQALTAAHKTLPFGTRVRVKSLVNGKEVVVRINDRGPFIKGRIIDLSQAAAQALGLSGVKQVLIERLKQ
jgi:rare lipoprotein A